MSADTKPCPKCQGLGEVVARSRGVGNGAVNDDWDTCPACNGTGRAKAPEGQRSAWSDDPRTISHLEVEALR